MDATSNLERNDTKVFHLMCPSPLGGLPLGTLITTRADENTITEALGTDQQEEKKLCVGRAK